MYAYTGRGLGSDNTDAQQGVQVGAGVATPVIGGIVAAHAASVAAATGAPALILGMAPAIAIPIIGAAMVAVTMLAIALIKNSGCGQTCVITSQWANQAAEALQKNSDAYFALPVPRSKAAQGVALANFDAIWAALVAQCGQPGTGDAGKRCVSDRQQGACVWHQNRSGGYPGEPAMGECWNWWNGYRDPIANDPNVGDIQSVGSAIGSEVSSLFGSDAGAASWLPVALVGGLVLWAVAS